MKVFTLEYHFFYEKLLILGYYAATNKEEAPANKASDLNTAVAWLVSVEKKEKLKNVKVFCRVVKCINPDVIPKIIRTNNTQNVISSWDRYSNSTEQIAIKKKMEQYHEGNYAEANRGKNNIFLNNSLYTSIFNTGTKARHLILTYTLSKAIDNVKYNVKFGLIDKEDITDSDKKKLLLFRNLKFKCF